MMGNVRADRVRIANRLMMAMIVGSVLASCTTGSNASSAPSTTARQTTPQSPSQSGPVVVGGTGTVIAWTPSDIVFNNGICELDYGNRPPNCSPPEVRIEGVDLSQFTGRSPHGEVWGSAYLTGTLVDGVLHVTSQGPPRYAHGGTEPPPPCSPPPGGWRGYGGTGAPLARYVRAHRGEIIRSSTGRAGHVDVLVVASTDPARTRKGLAASYPNAVCVVQSNYTADEVRHASSVARLMVTPVTAGEPPDWVTHVEVTLTPEGQPLVQVFVTFDNPAVRRGVASLPGGLVEIVPWLKPVAG